MSLDYTKALKQLSSARNVLAGKPIANNTRLFARSGDTVAVQLHDTDIIVFHKDGSFTLDSGGWRTVTTKARMNEFSPAMISQSKGIWTVNWHGGDNRPTDPRSDQSWDNFYRTGRYAFEDGLRFYTDGKVRNASGKLVKPEDSAKKTTAEEKRRNRVNAFAKAFIEALYAGKVPAPSLGDCWICQMREVQSGKPLGEVTRDSSHIESHIAERYFVPSLLYNALNAVPSSMMEKMTVQAIWSGQESPLGKNDGFIRKGLVKRLRKYLYLQLGLVA